MRKEVFDPEVPYEVGQAVAKMRLHLEATIDEALPDLDNKPVFIDGAVNTIIARFCVNYTAGQKIEFDKGYAYYIQNKGFRPAT